MVIPVFWLSFNPDAIPRGYWDQAMLEGLFDGTVWDTPGRPGFNHYVHDHQSNLEELTAATHAGGILVVPARHHATVGHITKIKRLAAQMAWCLLILTGDEEGIFYHGRFRTLEQTRLWIMSPQPGREYGDAHLIGSGWPPGIREVLADETGERSIPWAFLGQNTHPRRHDCVAMLEARADRPDAVLVETQGFTEGIAQDDYWRTLAATKVAPCPGGPLSADSFRVYEALEAGCVPIADNRHAGETQIDYWQTVFGAVPFPTVQHDWAAETVTIDRLLDGWPTNGDQVFSWWQREKRKMASRLYSDIAKVAGDVVDRADPAQAITALIVTSPTPHHPSIEHLETTIRSVRDQLGNCEIVLVFDGVRRELLARAPAYAEYVRRALWAANTRWGNVVPLVLDSWHHQAQAARQGLDLVESRHVLFVEHDTPLTGEVDWAGIVETLDRGELDLIRLHHETTVGEPHRHMMLEQMPRDGFAVPVLRTYQWSQRPHVAHVGWYRRVLDLHFAPEARCMIEDVMHGVVVSAWIEYGIAGWSRFRLALYHPDGNVQRSLHLDSRRLVVGEEASGDEKGQMLFAYPGDTPSGAPAPGRR